MFQANLQSILLIVCITIQLGTAFQLQPQRCSISRTQLLLMTTQEQSSISNDPLLLRAARGEQVERVPVWMMRQAGRHMAAYRELSKKYTTFRERSEIPEVSAEIR
jgi:hypothetical protein